MQTTLFLLIFAAKRKQTQKYDTTCKQQHTPHYPPRAYCVRGGLSYAGDADSKTDDNGNNKALPHQKAKLFDGEGLI
ncbi:MAG: hypothetical protein II852_10600 [Bacteroidales bacterium]|nr:hypothetical protein [Bacteroidales bacterium]